MKIVLLGAKGMLGRALQAEFEQTNVVAALDQDEVDITNEEMVRRLVSKVKPEVIINAAAYTNVDGAEIDRETAQAVNEIGVGNIARVAEEIDAVLVHYSTDYVFDGKKQAGYKEDDLPGPAVNSYGASKLAGERLLKTINPKFYLIRTAWLYGAGGKNFVDTMVGLGQQLAGRGREQQELRVVNDQWGSPTYTVDLAQATRRILDGRLPWGIYHLVNDGVTTWYELAVKIFENIQQDVTVTPVASTEYPRPAKRPTWSVLINEKGPKLRAWQNALAEYLGGGMMDNESPKSR